MQKHIEQIFNLARRTGDKVIVADQYDPEGGYVIMGIDQYQELVEGDTYWHDEECFEDNLGEPLSEPWEDELEGIDFNEDFDDEEDFEFGEYNKGNRYEDNIFDMGEDDEILSVDKENNDEIPFPEDYYPANELEIGNELDNNREYGNIDHIRKQDKREEKSSKWEIAEDIKNTGETDSLDSDFSEEDRYYLETI